MSEVAAIVTTPYPMEGFEGEYLDKTKFYSRFRQIGNLLKEKREKCHIQGSATLSSLMPDRNTYLLSTPRENTIELFTFPHRSEQTPPPTPPEPTKERPTLYLDAFYGVLVTFALAALKMQLAGEPTRAIDISQFALHRKRKKASEGWILHRRGRINQAILHRMQAADVAPEWTRWFKKIHAALLLEDGWNGDDAPPPEVIAAVNATKFLNAMHQESYPPTRIAASAMGGIAVTRKVGNKKVLVEFYNDGKVYFLFSDRGSGSMDVKLLLLDQDSLTRFVASMRDFLNG